MGIMDAIKNNLNQGGVSVQIFAEPVIPRKSPFVFSVRVTANESIQQIKGVQAQVEREETSTGGVRFGGSRSRVRDTQDETRRVIVARAENAESFTLNPGEYRDVQLTLTMQQENQGGGLFAPLNAITATLGKISNMVNKPVSTHLLSVTANVEGVMLDPTERVLVQVVDAAASPQPPTSPQAPSPPQPPTSPTPPAIPTPGI